MSKALIVTAAIVSGLLCAVCSLAAGPKISDIVTGGNKHNLSSLNKNVTYQAQPVASPGDEHNTEICIFCHTPHHSNQQGPLWNRSDTTTTFGRYSSATLIIRKNAAAQYGEPTGSSRLCLSCHDGVTALGVVLSEVLPINMGPNDRITGIALFDANKIKTGHHPISFVYNDAVLGAIQADPVKSLQTYRLPTLAEVKLDSSTQMQCTTCHNPHQNQSTEEAYITPPNVGRKIAPFWVYGATGSAVSDRDTVCLNCHNLTITPFP
ncbi:MAG: cytochrome c family [Geobacteraceae bacterium]|nr:MAG: cytochrome c family [Geobacteraceae bacterium]